jgi:uncharacterized protein
MDESYERQGDIFMTDLKMEPSEYFKRQCVVSVEPDEVTALHLMEELGSHLVFSTDYPHVDSRYPESVDDFLKLPISDDAKRRILWDNCARFYSVDVDLEVAPAGGSHQAAR